MPLAKDPLEQAFLAAYQGKEQSVPAIAKKLSDKIYEYCISVEVMTQVNIIPGGVVLAITAGPVNGKGLGGLDKPAPGAGLIQDALVAGLEKAFKLDPGATYEKKAADVAQAIHEYYKEMMVQTQDKTTSVLPAPPPVGPVTGTIIGKGGTTSPSPGSGLAGAKEALADAFTAIWTDVKDSKPMPTMAKRMGAAIHTFCKEGKIRTTGVFTVPAVVSPVTLNGAYLTGVCMSIGTVE